MTNRRASGFTLIELMVVVAVVAILATIAYPSYQAQMRKSRRAEAISALQDLQLRQERWRVDHATYATTFTGMPQLTQYAIAMTAASATGYILTATPKTGTSQVRDSCGTLTLTSENNIISKSPSGSGCW